MQILSYTCIYIRILANTSIYVHIHAFTYTCGIQDVRHALAGRVAQLLVHDAETSRARISICARTLPLDTLVTQFSHLTRNVFGPAHANEGPWGVQNRVHLLVAPHGPLGISPNLDLKWKDAFKGLQKGLAHDCQLLHVVVIWCGITVQAIPAYTYKYVHIRSYTSHILAYTFIYVYIQAHTSAATR